MAASGGSGGRGAGAGAHGTLVHLSSKNPILERLIGKKLALGPSQEDAEPQDVHIGEYDGMGFHLVVPEDALHMLHLGVSAPFFSSIPRGDLESALSTDYPGLDWTLSGGSVAGGALSESSVVISVDCRKVGPELGPKMAEALSRVRDTVLGAPLARALRSAREDAKSAAVELSFRAPHEALWVIPRPGQRVTVIWCLDLAERMDRAIARIVCQEMVENQRRVTGSPSVHFTDSSASEPPQELRGRPVPKGPGHVGFLSFSLEKRHVDDDKKLRQAVATLTMLRAYLTYHIKAAKSYLHTRMRKRVAELLLVLNRAKPDDPLAKKAKKTMSGKTFTRKI